MKVKGERESEREIMLEKERVGERDISKCDSRNALRFWAFLVLVYVCLQAHVNMAPARGRGKTKIRTQTNRVGKQAFCCHRAGSQRERSDETVRVRSKVDIDVCYLP